MQLTVYADDRADARRRRGGQGPRSSVGTVRDSLDLLLDAAGERAVRAEGAALAERGLADPFARTTGHHAPHLTVAERDEVADEVDARLGVLTAHLPLALDLGPVVVLGGADRRFLARAVLPTPGLLALHADAAGLLGPGGPPHGAVGAWLPHVTVSGRLADADVPGALAALDLGAGGPGSPAYRVVGERLRRWLPREGVVRDL